MKGKLMKKIGIKMSTVFAVTMVAVMAVPFVALAEVKWSEEEGSQENVDVEKINDNSGQFPNLEGTVYEGDEFSFTLEDNQDFIEFDEIDYPIVEIEGLDFSNDVVVTYNDDSSKAFISFNQSYINGLKAGDVVEGSVKISFNYDTWTIAEFKITIIAPEEEDVIEEDPVYDDPADTDPIPDDLILDPGDFPTDDIPRYINLRDRNGNPTRYVAYVEPVTTNVSYSSPKTGEDMSYNYVVAALSMLALSSLAIIAKINRA